MANLPSEAEIDRAWRKARPAHGRDSGLYRIAPDIIQSLIRRDRFNVCGEHGWRIEHGKPVSFRATSVEETMKLVQYEMYTALQLNTAKTTSSRKN